MGLGEAELADRAGHEPGLVGRLVDLGLIAPGPDGTFDPGLVLPVRLLGAFESSGISLEHVARGYENGDLTFGGLERFFDEPAPFAGMYRELAARLGRPPELVARLVVALGFPEPSADDRVRADEAAILESALAAWSFVEDEEIVRVVRGYGENLRRVAEGEVSFYERTVPERARESASSESEAGEVAGEVGTKATAFSKTVVPWLHRRHFERALMEYMTSSTEQYLERSGLAAPRPRRPPAISFLDLSGYTRLTEEQGDERAADLAASLSGIVDAAARTRGGKAVKWLGDGVMFYFADPGSAVLSALEVLDQAGGTGLPPARVGINAGPVVFQDGDYFGRTVNVAARIADYARPHEVLVSEEARRIVPHDEVGFEEIGDIPLRGVPTPVRLHRVVRR